MTLSMPPAPNGSPQQMAVAQYAYLFQMAQQLNLALGQLESGGTGAASGGGTSTHQGTGRKESTGYQELKSLDYVKTARLVKRQMEQLFRPALEGEYVAVSDFGTYVERLSAYLEANPEALTQYYSFAQICRLTPTPSAPPPLDSIRRRRRAISAPASWAITAPFPFTEWPLARG